MNFKKVVLLFFVGVIAFTSIYYVVIIPEKIGIITTKEILVKTGLIILFILSSTFFINRLK